MHISFLHAPFMQTSNFNTTNVGKARVSWCLERIGQWVVFNVSAILYKYQFPSRHLPVFGHYRYLYHRAASVMASRMFSPTVSRSSPFKTGLPTCRGTLVEHPRRFWGSLPPQKRGTAILRCSRGPQLPRHSSAYMVVISEVVRN